MPSDAMNGPQWDFGWRQRFTNEFGEKEKHLLHPDNPVPLPTTFIHAEGKHGTGITAPSGRDYGAVIEGIHDPQPTGDERKWGIGPRPGQEGYARNWQLRHVQEYSGINDVADKVVNALQFLETTGTGEVSFEHDEHPPVVDSDDLVKNLYEKRPNFPRTFKTPERAVRVAETLIKRRDAGIPLTPRPRRK